MVRTRTSVSGSSKKSTRPAREPASSIATRWPCAQGAAQIALVGPPDAGKSSLLHALSDVQIKIGNYAFTTLRPVPALVRIDGVLVQFVEIPGLLEGANDDAGGGRAYLGVLREADAIVYCQDATASPDDLRTVMCEVARAGIERPGLLALTKFDDANPGSVGAVRRCVSRVGRGDYLGSRRRQSRALEGSSVAFDGADPRPCPRWH